MIQLKQVQLTIKDRVLIRDLNLHVPQYQAHSIVGPSGSGKSVILKLIAGLLQASAGTIEVRSDRVSMLFQKNALFDSFTILENLLVPLSETLGIQGGAADDRARSMLAAVGLEEAAHLYPDEISGGMQKRLGIARALIVDPEVILYDEPTAGLDPITSRSIVDLILKLHRSNRTTLLMVTNDLQRAYQISDQLWYCQAGRLTSIGSPAEVQKSTDPEIRNFIYSNALNKKPAESERV